MSRRNSFVSVLTGLFALAFACTAFAQTRTIDLYLDINSGASGCDAHLNAIGATLEKLDRRLMVTVNVDTDVVTDVAMSKCEGGSFTTPTSIGGGYPVGLNSGLNNADVVEFGSSLFELDFAASATVTRAYLLAQNPDTGGQDLLATSNGHPGGRSLEPFADAQLPVSIPIPVLGTTSAILLLLVVLISGLVYTRRYKKAGLLGMLLISGLVIAANYVADGDVSEWLGTDLFATDPSGDPLPVDDPSIDIEAFFVHLEGQAFLLRVDLRDIENTQSQADPSSETTLEDTAVEIFLNGTDADSDHLTFSISVAPVSGSLGAITQIDSNSASVVYTPDADFNGADGFSFVTHDGTLHSEHAVVDIEILPVNDAPSFVLNTPAPVLQDSGPQSFPDTASAILRGPADEFAQVLVFNITANSNPALFDSGPLITADGTLSFTPASGIVGTASISVELMDDGGTADGGVDTSSVQVFNIVVDDINDQPSFTAGPDQTVDEDSGPQSVAGWATGIDAGSVDEAGQVLTFLVTANTNPGLFSTAPAIDPATGTLSYTPADDANGSADITVELKDNGGTANGGVDTSIAQIFKISVDPVNDAPVLTIGSSQSVLEDSGAHSVPAFASATPGGGADESGQVVSFNIGNDNNALFSAQPAIDGSGGLTYTPADGATGSALITVSAMDDAGTANGGVDTSAEQTFTITVGDVNDPPAFTAGADQTVDEDAGPQTVNGWATAISPGPANESGQTVSFNMGNDNNALFSSQPAVDSAGTLTYTSATGANGMATVTVQAVDDGGTADGGIDTSASQMFTITVTAVNSAPVLAAIGDKSIDELLQLSFTASATDPNDTPPDNLAFSLSGEPAGASISAAGVFSWTPDETQGPGMFTFDVIVTDDGTNPANLSDSETITVTVNEVNLPPVLAAIGDQSGEEGINITFTASANDPDLPANSLSFSLSGEPSGAAIDPGTGVFNWTPTEEQGASGAAGMHTFDVIVTDDGSAPLGDLETITITVNEANQNPVAADSAFEATGNVGIDVLAGSGLLIGSSDPDQPPQVLSTTSETVATSGGGSASIASDGSFTYTPVVGFTGDDTFSFTVTDGDTGSDTGTATITVSDMIWFIDNSNTVAGDGTLSSPFDAISGFETATGPVAGDCIYVDETGSGDYSAPLTLLDSQILVGKGASTSIDTECGITLAVNSTALPTTNGTRPVISNNTDTISLITLAINNKLTGLNLNQGSASTAGLTGNDVGSLMVDQVSALGAGGAIQVLASGSFGSEVNFDTLQCNTTDQACIQLNGVSGSMGILSAGTGIASSGNQPAISVSGGSVSFVYPGDITGSGSAGTIRVVGHNTGALGFTGNVSATNTTSVAIDLDNFGSVSFSGGVTINNTSSNGLIAVNSGTIEITGAANQLTTTTGTAVTIADSTIGADGVTFQSVSVDGAASGIVLLNTGAGSFTVTGDGSKARNASGGTIQNTTQDGIQLTNASNVTLQSISLLNVGNTSDPSNGGNTLANNDHAIQSEGGSDIVLSGVHIQNPAASGWEAVNLGGSNSIDSDSLIERIDTSNMQALEVRNTSTDMALFTIDSSQISDQASSNGSTYVQFNGFGTSVMTVTVTDSVFENIFGQALAVNADESAITVTSITGSVFRDALPGMIGVGASGGIGGISISASQNAVHDFNIDGNTFFDLGRPLVNGGLINIQGIAGFGKTLDGVINNNDIDRVGFTLDTGTDTSGGYRVIDLVTENNIIFLDGEITNNFIDETGREAIFVSSRGMSADFDASIINNVLGQTSVIGSSEREAIEILSEEMSTMAIIVDNNLVNGNADFNQIVDVDAENLSTLDISFTNNAVTNALSGPEIVVDTEDVSSSLCMAFTGNTADEAEFDVDGTFRVEDYANRVTNNPGIITFIDGIGVTDIAPGTCVLPTF